VNVITMSLAMSSCTPVGSRAKRMLNEKRQAMRGNISHPRQHLCSDTSSHPSARKYSFSAALSM